MNQQYLTSVLKNKLQKMCRFAESIDKNVSPFDTIHVRLSTMEFSYALHIA